MNMNMLFSLCCIVTLVYTADHEQITIDVLSNHPQLIPAVVELWWAGQGILQTKYTKKPTAAIIDALQNHPTPNSLPLCLIALKNGQPVGMVRLNAIGTTRSTVAPKVAAHPEWSPWINGLIVDEAHQKKGIDSTLLEAAQKKAQELGYKTLYLAADEEHCEWYEHHGFERFETDTVRGEPLNLLRLSLMQEE